MSDPRTTIRDYFKLRDRLAAEFPVPESARAVLLDLALARMERRAVDVTGAKIASGLTGGSGPHASLCRLENMGLIVRRPDPHDGRRIWLDITDDGFARIEALLCPGVAIARAA